MRPDRSIYSQALLKLLATVIAVVVGLHFGPSRARPHSSTPLVSSIEQRVPTDTFKAGDRVEPRVLRAPIVDRLPPIPLPRLLGSLAVVDGSRRPDDVARMPETISEGQRSFFVKHVPRMERGDPPRT
jgi:hypothetical protein